MDVRLRSGHDTVSEQSSVQPEEYLLLYEATGAEKPSEFRS